METGGPRGCLARRELPIPFAESFSSSVTPLHTQTHLPDQNTEAREKCATAFSQPPL